ncbi:MAG: CHASE2 domain-containing protein, partial [Spirochaetales bacterium]|nr:CHASE2 domain-containing protein [Spirochaetales bacterium]
MTLRKRSGLLAFACAALFSLLYLAGLLEPAEDSVYDFFLRFRPVRERAGNVLFLDVDDLAIADIGVFPWPRSVMAGGLLRLKEYGAALAVFDIEYIDRSPAGVDEVYMGQGLSADFQRVFSEISSGVSGFTGSVLSGRGKGREAEDSRRLVESIEKRRDYLLGKAQDIAVDNDEYLARAARLF